MLNYQRVYTLLVGLPTGVKHSVAGLRRRVQLSRQVLVARRGWPGSRGGVPALRVQLLGKVSGSWTPSARNTLNRKNSHTHISNYIYISNILCLIVCIHMYTQYMHIYIYMHIHTYS